MLLPIIDISNQPLSVDFIKSLDLIGEIILRIPDFNDTSLLSQFLETYQLDRYWLFPIKEIVPNDIENIIQFLDQGAQKVVIPASNILTNDSISTLPVDRLAVSINSHELCNEELSKKLAGLVSGYLVTDVDLESISGKFFQDLSNFIQNVQKTSDVLTKFGIILKHEKSEIKYSLNLVQHLSTISADLVVPIKNLTLDSDNNSLLNVADALTCTLTSDRPDGLFTTIVVDERGVALGVVYSSTESVKEALKTRKGVYQSRKRGLWYKGATSGSVQELKKIEVDCDGDVLQFTVKQFGTGFCHLNTRTCFGGSKGLSALEETLQSRKTSAPPGSYTQRLFQNPDLLRSKIMEEADELCSATTKENIAWETADLLYFALVKCVANDVSLTDVEAHLDKRAKKVTRRPGNAKSQWDISAKKTMEIDGDAKDKQIPISKSDTIKMQKFKLSEIDSIKRTSLLKRPIINSDDIMARVRPIMNDVRNKGDTAIIEYTAKFDKVQLSTPVISAPFPPEAMALDDVTRRAIDQAYDNIYKFHDAQYDRSTLVVETIPGVVCSRFSRPIERVGLYVPGGTAILPSTTLMLGIPAKVAGCKEIIIASPPRKDGTVVPEVLYVAHKVGASKVLLAGGAQAVAALAYGTESVPKVDKICGPGNQYVTAAKMFAQNDSSAMISIDMPAGPSELLVIADNSSIPTYVASDLLSQAEHGTDSQVVLIGVCLTPEHLADIEREIHEQASRLPRVDIVRESISKSFILQVNNMNEAMKFSNDYSPEHLILHIDDAEKWVNAVENAGSVFIGAYSPESCGDYASGTNHTLPTYGYARMHSGVNTLTFLKHITAQKLTKQGLKDLGHTVMRLAEIEGLEAHRNAVYVRIRDLENE
ncbi:histidinol dehydrogenase-domain-containing protein [Gigaspora margarita]|uniref:Histidine biosynthesis trifunctional protein n=1 Tax=Gigaspora margarita TaxID=4874 RepID=A0A8H3WSY7_GIGMA|nr:histidinol dehydrogenase-domain-containing protein [Gigaspora margarita]